MNQAIHSQYCSWGRTRTAFFRDRRHVFCRGWSVHTVCARSNHLRFHWQQRFLPTRPSYYRVAPPGKHPPVWIQSNALYFVKTRYLVFTAHRALLVHRVLLNHAPQKTCLLWRDGFHKRVCLRPPAPLPLSCCLSSCSAPCSC